MRSSPSTVKVRNTVPSSPLFSVRPLSGSAVDWRPAGDATRPAGDATRPAGDATRPAGDAAPRGLAGAAALAPATSADAASITSTGTPRFLPMGHAPLGYPSPRRK